MADLTYDVRVNTQQAEANLGKLQKSVSGINDNFIRLRETIATISLGATIAGALSLADSIQDLSDATGIASANILGFSKAVSASGGNSEVAQAGLLRLVNTIGEAADGSKQAQRAFSEVGVSLNDLATLSEQDILAKTIQGLSKIDDAAKRSTLTTTLLGKGFRGVGLQGVAGDYDAAVRASQKYSEAIKSAAEVQDKLDATIKNFQLSLLKAIKPLADFLNKIDPDKIQIFIDKIINIGTALAGLYVFGKIATGIETFILAMRASGAATAATTVALAGAGNVFALFALGLKQVIGAFNLSTAATVATYTGFSTLGIVVKSVATGFLRMLPLIGYAVVAFQVLDGVVETLTGKGLGGWFDEAAAGFERFMSSNFPELTKRINELGEALGMGASPSQRAENEAELKRIQARADAAKAAADAEKKRKEALRQVQTDLAKTGLDIRQQTDDYEEQLRFQQQRMGNETKLLLDNGKLTNISADQLEIEKAKLDLLYGQRSIIQGFQKQIERINLEQKLGVGDAPEVASGKINQLKDAILTVQTTTGFYTNTIEKYIVAQQTARILEAARQKDIENLNKSLEDQYNRQQMVSDSLRTVADQQKDLNFASSLKGMSPLQKEIAQTRESARKAALEAGRAYAAAFEDSGDGLSQERAKELTDGLTAIYAAYKNIGEAQVAALGSANELTNGLSSAWDDYKTKAIDTAGQIKSSFENLTSGLEDAFVKFVQGGKLSFSDLANSILADLARIAFKKAVVFAAGLFGFANGGSVMGGVPVVVGERGPELFVPQSAGKIIANNQLGGSGASSGPAPSNVVYNIQAVDAASFRSLVARDPSFIYAVTEQGRRSQPTRRAG